MFANLAAAPLLNCTLCSEALLISVGKQKKRTAKLRSKDISLSNCFLVFGFVVVVLAVFRVDFHGLVAAGDGGLAAATAQVNTAESLQIARLYSFDICD